MRGQCLRDQVRSEGVEATYHRLAESLELGSMRDEQGRRLHPEELNYNDLTIRELAEGFMGDEWVRRLHPGNSRFASGVVPLREAGEAVDVTAFSNITGQIYFSVIKEAWDTAEALGDQLVETRQTDLDGEKIPWITPPLVDQGKVTAGMNYPEAGMGEEFIQTPSLDTYGNILSIHKLTIFYDRTGQIVSSAKKLGVRMKKAKNRRILNALLNAPTFNTPAPQFIWKGVTYNPYQGITVGTGTGSGGNGFPVGSLNTTPGTYWTNYYFGVPMVDYTSIEQIEIAATKILEPDLQGAGVNEPIEINLDTIVVMPFKKWTVQKTLAAIQVRTVDLGVTPNIIGISGNPIDKTYSVISDKQLYQQAIGPAGFTPQQANDFWFMIDSKNRPLLYMQAWPLTLVEAPPQNPAEFERDIVLRVKASERGVVAWQDPRMIFWVRNL